jgi:tetratricopeptide (TPR) repeat protein
MKQRAFPARRWGTLIASLTVVLALGGCATPQVTSLQQRWPETLQRSAMIRDVPFYPQSDYQCGPAALAMAAGAAGVSVSPEQLVDQVYLPGRQGTLQLEMLAATRRMGLVAYQISPDISALLKEVGAGNPVIVLQNLSFEFAPVWHYAVVIGFDRERNTLVMHSGRTERMEMSLYTFERTWSRADRWAMLAMRPDRLPATANATAYAASIAVLERSSAKAARTAYVTALRQWPTEPILQLGAGNTAYAMKDLNGATSAYRNLVKTHPDNADGWNNLAQVLLDQGRHRDALTAINRAVSLGGPRLSSYQKLRQEIQAKL